MPKRPVVVVDDVVDATLGEEEEAGDVELEAVEAAVTIRWMTASG